MRGRAGSRTIQRVTRPLRRYQSARTSGSPARRRHEGHHESSLDAALPDLLAASAPAGEVPIRAVDAIGMTVSDVNSSVDFHSRILLKPKELLAFGNRWRPYRTVASWYIWRAFERAGYAATNNIRPAKVRRKGK